MDANPLKRCSPHARRGNRRAWGLASRLAVVGMLVAASSLMAADASRGILRQLVHAGQPQVIPVMLTETTLDPAVIVLRPGAVRFAVRNAGSVPLRFSVRGPATAAETDALPPGAEARLDVTFAHPGTYVITEGAQGAATDVPGGILTVRP